MPGAALEDVMRGWVIGMIIATLIVRRAERRGIAVDRDEVVERCALSGAAVGALAAVLRNLP